MHLRHQVYSLNFSHTMDSVLQHQLFYCMFIIIKDIPSTLFYYGSVSRKPLRKKMIRVFLILEF